MDSIGNTQPDENVTRARESAGTPGIFGLLRGIIEDLKQLFWQQVQLAVHELKMEADRMVTIVTIAVSLGILTTLCVTFLLMTAVTALHETLGIAIWMSCGVIALVLMLVVGCLGFYLRHQMQRFRLLPIRALYTVKEDVQWIKEWIASPKT